MKLLARFFAGLLVSALVLLALVMGCLRLAVLNIEYYKSEIEYLLERDASPAIVFTGLSGAMDRFNPILRIDNVSMTLPDRSQPLFIDRLEVEFDFWASLRERTLVVREVTGKLEKLELVKDQDGHWWISDLALAVESDSGPTPGFKQVLALVPRYLKLDLNRLIVHDRKTSTTHQLSDVNAQINHRQNQFFIRFGASLPDQLGQSVLVKSIVGEKRSLVYVNSSNLQLIPVARLLDLDTWGLQQGALDGEVWINMAGYEVLAVNGNMQLADGVLQMSADRNPLQVTYHSRFSAIKRSNDWRITSWFDRLRVDNREVAGFHSQIQVDRRSVGRLVSAWVDRMPLESLPVVAGQWLPAKINQQISEGHLNGELKDVLLRIDLDRPEQFLLGASARGVSSLAFANFPGATNLDADILIGKNRLDASVRGKNVSVDFGDHFSAPLEFDSLAFDAVAQRTESGLLLAVDDLSLANADANAIGRAWMKFDRDERPFVFIRGSFSDGRASSTSKYLPRKFMPAKTQRWLDRAIKQGRVPAGEIQYHGRLRDIRKLERDGAVEFFADFRVEDAEVLFSPDWLPAKNGSGQVFFHNVSMNVDLDRLSYDRIDNARARATIADFRDPLLKLHIETESSAADAVQSWIDTPVGSRFHDAIDKFHDFGGGIGTAIEVELPLHAAVLKPTTEVQVTFNDASAKSDHWELDLSRINGRLDASGETLRAREIDARFFGDPVKVDIAGDESSGHTLVTARGELESANLVRKLPEFLTRGISGRSDWQVSMDFSPESRPANVPVMHLEAASDLKNTVVELPRPFYKTAAAESHLLADIDFFAEHIRFAAKLDDRVRSRGLLAGKDDDFGIKMLDLAFATNLLIEPERGVHLHGYIEETSTDKWIKVFEDQKDKNPELLQSVRLQLGKLHAFGREIDNLQIDLQQKKQRFVGNLNSAVVSGGFDVPLNPGSADPAIIDLDYLRIDRQEGEDRLGSIHPGDLFDFRLTSKVFLFHDMLLQGLLVDARVNADRLFIDRLELVRDKLKLTGSGQWDYDPASDTQVSSINVNIEGPGLGQAINGLGFGDTMSNGTLDFQGGFTWAGPITSVELERLAGDAKMTITDGVLNNVEPGSGRYVGLLSLSALPRRLSLDFSDMLIKGMEFSKITGTYRIEDGVLYTRNTRMDGPAAKIRISGKTGIADRSYDQTIKVTPKIRETLPVIGAVSAGSTVGWGLLLLQNLFKKVIDDAVEVEYKVTGSWDDPKIELVKAVDEKQRELPKIDR